MLIGFRVCNRKPPRDSLHFTASRDKADVGLQPAEDLNPSRVPVVKHPARHSRHSLRLHGQRQPDVSRRARGRSFKLSGGYSHYGETVTVEQDTVPGDVWVRAENSLPYSVTQHRDRGLVVRPQILWNDQPAAGGTDAEHCEVVAGNQFARDSPACGAT